MANTRGVTGHPVAQLAGIAVHPHHHVLGPALLPGRTIGCIVEQQDAAVECCCVLGAATMLCSLHRTSELELKPDSAVLEAVIDVPAGGDVYLSAFARKGVDDGPTLQLLRVRR